MPTQHALDEAYLHFKSWRKRCGIVATQPPFKSWMVLWSLIIIIRLKLHMFTQLHVNMLANYGKLCFIFSQGFILIKLLKPAEIFKKPNGTQICFTAKAFNGRVLSQWLNDCLCDAVSKAYHDDHDQLVLLSSCMFLGFCFNKFLIFHFKIGMRYFEILFLGVLSTRISPPLRTYLVRWYCLQEKFQRFMDREERQQYYEAARGFIRRYVALARQAARRL